MEGGNDADHHHITMSARVLIVDDHPAFRSAARELLEHRGLQVVGEAADEERAVHLTTGLSPDAVLLDVHLGEDDGLAVARALSRARPGTAILLTSCRDLGASDRELADSGARGFVLKSDLAGADLPALPPFSSPCRSSPACGRSGAGRPSSRAWSHGLRDVVGERARERVAERQLHQRAHDRHVLGVRRQRVGRDHPAALGRELRGDVELVVVARPP